MAAALHILMPNHQRGAECSTRIPRRRLDPDVVERAVAKDLAVADAIERDTAGEAEVALTRLARSVSRDLEHHLFGHFLNARGEIEVALREIRLRLARRSAEQTMKAIIGHR